VEQSAFADFEQRIYAMDPDDLTVDVVFDLFEEVGADYGFDAWGIDGSMFVSIQHFFTSPCYVFSYVVSNDAALQLYQMEAKESGAGLELFLEQLATEEEDFLAFVEAAGLGSPFADGRIESVAETFREILFEE
jgi:oligoendopeptidase F